jgi:hypothetical protein
LPANSGLSNKTKKQLVNFMLTCKQEAMRVHNHRAANSGLGRSANDKQHATMENEKQTLSAVPPPTADQGLARLRAPYYGQQQPQVGGTSRKGSVQRKKGAPPFDALTLECVA